MNLSKNKVAAGVIGLIAVVGIANTQAILSLTNYVKGGGGEKVVFSSEGQEAQVSLASASKCIQVLPRDTNYTHFIDAIDQSPSFDHTYYIGFKIINRCNRPISIIKDTDSNNAQFYNHFTVEDYLGVGEATAASIFHGTGPWKAYYDEIGAGSPQQNIPVANLSNVPYYTISYTAGPTFDPFNPPSEGYIVTSVIPANSSANFISAVNVKGGQLTEHYSRVFLNKFRWFFNQDYNNDGILSGNEIKTYNFTSEERKIVTTSFAKFSLDMRTNQSNSKDVINIDTPIKSVR